MRYVEWFRRVTLAAAATLGCAAVHADVYKWVDENGVVNYSNEAPPADRQATKISPSNPRLSFYKSVPPSAQELAQLSEYMRFRESVQLTEEANRGAVTVADPYPGWYQQCVFEMWADCDDSRALATRYGNPLWGYSSLLVGARLRPHASVPFGPFRPAPSPHAPLERRG